MYFWEKKKKRIQSFLLALLMVIIPVISMVGTSIVAKAEGEVTLKLHYHREDGVYTDWALWLWEEGKEGAEYTFDDVDGDMVATMEVTPGTTSVGFIVKTPAWDKDVNADQFIDIAEVASGTVDIYIESGVEGYTKELRDDVVIGIKVKKVKYQGDGTILVTMTDSISGDFSNVFTVNGKDGEVQISSVEEDSKGVYLVTLAEALNDFSSYRLSFEGTEYQVVMPVPYSTEEFEKEYTYTGDDLGATWSASSTTFRTWAPTAEAVSVRLYEAGTPYVSDRIDEVEMIKDVNGTWVVTIDGDLNKTYYTYAVTLDGKVVETVDPYARTTGVNGSRGMVIDLDSTDPEGWDQDVNPNAELSINDVILYEAHIRDLTVSSTAGITNAGKYIGVVETGTKTPGGVATGLDHLVDLGITHLHIMPMYDFGSVDETKKFEGLYNWGYDPVNYNVPEGSYATDAFHGEVRVNEVKQMVMGLHNSGISVVMDVVYNHVQNASSFSMNVMVPGYFSRISDEGTYSSGSGCGNDTATERSMVKKFIVDSVNYWADEYHIDGFRFDLVGLIDVDTINEIVETVHETHPDVIFYGEGWTLTTAPTKDDVVLATQPNAELTPGFAYFNDEVRDGLKGSVFDSTGKGYVQGATGNEAKVSRGFMAETSWCPSPSQTINYSGCHDNNTLFDKLQNSRSDASFEDLVKMNKLTAAYVFTAEGVPFMMGGEEFLRSKVNEDGTFNENSYNAGDKVNAYNYGCMEEEAYQAVNEYYKGLIAFRKAHPVLRLSTAEEVSAHVTQVSGPDTSLLGFDLTGDLEGESADEILVYFNPNEDAQTITLPEGKWNVYINGEKAGTEILETVSGETEVAAISSLVLVKEDKTADSASDSAESRSSKIISFILGTVAGLVVIFCMTKAFRRKMKK